MRRQDDRNHNNHNHNKPAGRGRQGGGGGGGNNVISQDACNVYVCMLPPSVLDPQLRELFTPFGQIASAKVMLNIHTGAPRGIAFVKYANPMDAQAAVDALNGATVDGKQIAVRIADAAASYQPGPPTEKLFVRNVPGRVTKAELSKYFQRFGKVTELTVHADTANNRRDAGKGKPLNGPTSAAADSKIAFVVFETVAEAQKAERATHNKMLFPNQDVPLLCKVSEANTKEVRKKRQQTRKVEQEERDRLIEEAASAGDRSDTQSNHSVDVVLADGRHSRSGSLDRRSNASTPRRHIDPSSTMSMSTSHPSHNSNSISSGSASTSGGSMYNRSVPVKGIVGRTDGAPIAHQLSGLPLAPVRPAELPIAPPPNANMMAAAAPPQNLASDSSDDDDDDGIGGGGMMLPQMAPMAAYSKPDVPAGATGVPTTSPSNGSGSDKKDSDGAPQETSQSGISVPMSLTPPRMTTMDNIWSASMGHSRTAGAIPGERGASISDVRPPLAKNAMATKPQAVVALVPSPDVSLSQSSASLAVSAGGVQLVAVTNRPDAAAAPAHAAPLAPQQQPQPVYYANQPYVQQQPPTYGAIPQYQQQQQIFVNEYGVLPPPQQFIPQAGYPYPTAAGYPQTAAAYPQQQQQQMPQLSSASALQGGGNASDTKQQMKELQEAQRHLIEQQLELQRRMEALAEAQ